MRHSWYIKTKLLQPEAKWCSSNWYFHTSEQLTLRYRLEWSPVLSYCIRKSGFLLWSWKSRIRVFEVSSQDRAKASTSHLFCFLKKTVAAFHEVRMEQSGSGVMCVNLCCVYMCFWIMAAVVKWWQFLKVSEQSRWMSCWCVSLSSDVLS